ncbi:MAG: aspartate 1-decarboxylase [Kiritimatiellia bacterium]|jgi:aspartate 1-decarboxylase
MRVKMLRAKIHMATVTEANVNYVGSITIDADLLKATGIRPNEVVLVADIRNGKRFETYVIAGEAGSGIICVNGAAAHLVEVSDQVIIFAHALLKPKHLDDHIATVVLCDEANRITQTLEYPSKV